MTELVIVADDLTGACDSAAPLHRRGRTSVVLEADGAWPGGPVLAVDTDSRHRDADEAAARVARATRRAVRLEAQLVKKIDSTLRGHVAVELGALAAAAGEVHGRLLLVVAPAFPGAGRTVRDGVVHVDGRPLATSSRDGDVLGLLARGGLRATGVGLQDLDAGRLPQRLAEAYAAGLDAVVVDGESDAHLDEVVAVSSGGVPVVLVGSGGLTRPLAGPTTTAEQPRADRGPTLLVVGSRAAASRAQRERLVEHGVVPVLLEGAGRTSAGSTARTAARVRRALREGPVVLSPDPAAPVVRADAPAIAHALAETAVAVLAEVGTLVATGGETARAVLTTAGAGHLVVTGEVEPGVVHAHVPGLGLDLVTKAGAFGDPDALLRCLPAAVRNPRGTS